jgi:hypothetical protein
MRRVRPRDWDALARTMKEPQFQEHPARYKREENLELISTWAPAQVRRLLKTDAFEEGFGEDVPLDRLADTYPVVVGMDISHVVVASARARGPGVRYVVSDVCALPFMRAVSISLSRSRPWITSCPSGCPEPSASCAECSTLGPSPRRGAGERLARTF